MLEHFIFAFALENPGVVDGAGGSVGCAFTSAAKLSLGAPGCLFWHNGASLN